MFYGVLIQVIIDAPTAPVVSPCRKSCKDWKCSDPTKWVHRWEAQTTLATR